MVRNLFFLLSIPLVLYAGEIQKKSYFNEPKVEQSYSRIDIPERLKRLSSMVRGPDDYEYLIVTTDALKDSWDSFISFNERRCLRTKVISIDTVKIYMSGSDDAEKLRNYIKQEYNDHNIVYVMLGGDDDPASSSDIPSRVFRARLKSNGTDYYDINDIAADMYFACLDGNWMGDSSFYGEGNDDLTWEVYVGRFPVDDATQLNNIINKTVKYSEAPVTDQVTNNLLSGDLLMGSYYGGDYADQYIDVCSDNGYMTTGFPAGSWNTTKLYDKNGVWDASDFRDSVNTNKPAWIDFIGHGNTGYIFKETTAEVTNSNYLSNGTNANFYLISSMSDMSGNFNDNTDCILEAFVTIQNGAVACIGDDNYAWIDDDGYDGPSQRPLRFFHDAIFNKKIHYLEMMHAYAKESNAAIIQSSDINSPPYYGAMRASVYVTNLLGDPALSIWTATPGNLTASYPSPLTTTTFSWNIGHPYTWVALVNANDSIICTQLTDTSGNCSITDQALADYVTANPNGNLKVRAKAHNFLPFEDALPINYGNSSITVTSPNGGESLVVGATHNITWTTTGTITNVKIEYSSDGGSIWTEVIASTSNTGSYSWTIPSIASANCKVKASDVSNGSVSDESDVVFTITTQQTTWDTYPTYNEYLNIMNKFESDYPGLCTIIEIGESVQGRKLLFAKISDNVSTDEAEPEFMYLSTIHGNETCGYILMLHLIDSLLSSYSTAPRIKNLVNNIEIWICPLSNPDGTYYGGDSTVQGAIRHNFNDKDLNRNFSVPGSEYGEYSSWEMETEAIIEFGGQHNFVMGALIFDGNENAGYPWAYMEKYPIDRNWYEHVAAQYADTAHANSPVDYFTNPNPIGYGSAGIDFFVAVGQILDHMPYVRHSRFLMFGLSNQYILSEGQLNDHWNYNYRSLLNCIEQVLYGIHGTVTDSITGNPLKATVFLEDHDTDTSLVYSSLSHGDYYRPIYAGTYNITFSAYGYESKTISGVNAVNNTATVLNVQLAPASLTYEDDSLAVRAILDTNGLYEISVAEVTDSSGGRIVYLQLIGKGLNTLPSTIGNLTALDSLNLSYNTLQNLPAEIGNLRRLIKLVLNVNNLTELPEEIGNLIDLDSLNLSHNMLTWLPAEIGNLKNLTKLDLSLNNISGIPMEIGNLTSLDLLDLSYNNLEGIPAEIGNLSNLVQLVLSYNNLTDIPSEIGNLNLLEWLYLNKNNLTTLPDEVVNLTPNNVLDLGYNKLDTNILSGTVISWADTYDPDWQSTQNIINPWDTYPTYNEYLNMMNKFETDYPGICKIEEFGTSVQGRKLLAAKISDNVSQDEKEPAFFYSANMAGNHLAPYGITLHLIDYLLSNYGSDALITRLVDSVEIWINPLTNPDGTYAGGDSTVSGAIRQNANGVDLNRDFHDPVNGLNPNLQMETEALINFEQQNNIVMGGDIRADEYFLYQWASQPTQTADVQWWELVSKQYADTVHSYCPEGYFTALNGDGIGNLFSEYTEVHGTKLDCSLYYNHCRTPVIGVSKKVPHPDHLLTTYWNFSYKALVNYIEQVLYGIRGTVTDSITGNPINAKVFVENHDKDSSHVYSHLPHGDYYRPIYEDTYEITFSAYGYYPKTISNVNAVNYSATVLNVELVPFDINIISPNGDEELERGMTYDITWDDVIDENVKIELFKVGALHSVIAASIPSISPFSWTIPDTTSPDSDYRIRITSVDNSTITDESNNNFTITKNAWNTYPTYDEYLSIMNEFEADYPSLCKIDTFGTSVQGRKLLAAKISDNVSIEEKEPDLCYSSTIHGDGITGYVFMLHLIDYLLLNYGSDPFVTRLVDSVEIWINPLANPDGTYAGGDSTVSGATRENANGVDLNRDFHDPINGLNPSLQKETEALINFEEQKNFVMCASVHSNMESVVYPWACQQAQTADEQWWILVSKQYADTVQSNSPEGYFTSVSPLGYINAYNYIGSATHGTKFDCSLYYNHCRTHSIELSNINDLPDSLLTKYWDYNYRSLLNYIEQVLYGISGTVTDSLTGIPLQAKIFVENHDKDSSHVYSHLPHGDYYRPIYEGTYDITFSADGYYQKTISGVNAVNNSAANLDVQLVTQSETFTLIFIIQDGKQLPIQGAAVTIINTSKISDSTGKAEFELENGLYSYTVSKSGYKDSKGNIEVNGSDTVENVTLVSLTAPVCRISPITTEQSDSVFISFMLEDLEYDTLQISCQFSVNDSIWQDATFSGISQYIDSSQYAEGKTLSLTWLSKSDISNCDLYCVYFQIIPNDGSSGIVDTIQFHLDNYQGQSVTLTTPVSKQCGDVIIPYSTIDSTNDSITFKCYYSIDVGQNWTQTYNVNRFKVSPSEYDGDIKWSSSADIGMQDFNSVLLRIIPYDGLGDGIYGVTDSFHIDNSPIPMVVTLIHNPTVNNDTVITPVKITALDFSSVRIIDVNFSVENGIKLPASLLTNNTIQSVDYDSAVIIWPSKRDYASNSSNVKLHFTFRAGSYVQDLTTPPFILNNNEAPSVKIDSVIGDQFGDVNIPFKIIDTDYDIVNIILQYFDDVSSKWEPATFSGNLSGTISGIDSSHFSDVSITWKSGRDFPKAFQKSVLFKITPFDDDTGFADSISLTITNVGVPICDTIIFLEGGVDTLSDSITFLYLLKDDDEDTLNISLYYSSDTGWVKTDNVTGQTTGITPSGYLGSLTWASQDDLPDMWRPYIRLKLTPEDEHRGQSGESRIFVLKNFDTTVAITGDFSGDNKVDFNDFSYVSNYWHKSAKGVTHPDSIKELAPYIGDIPYLIVNRDSLFNHKDLSVFIQMCYWSHDNLGDEKLDYSLPLKQNTTSQPEKQSIQISIPNITDIHILFNVENISELVSCRYSISYDENILTYNKLENGKKLKENNGDIFSLVHKNTDFLDIGLARLSSQARAVSGNGSIAEVLFSREKNSQSKIFVRYELVNAHHTIIESGIVELVVPEFEEENTSKNFFIAFPNPSTPSNRKAPFELIDNPNALQWVQSDNSGFILQFSLNELKYNTRLIKASIKIFDAVGNLVNSTPFTDLTLKRDNLNDKTITIYWNGFNKNGRKVGGGTYKVILHYESQIGKGILSGNIGVKQK